MTCGKIVHLGLGNFARAFVCDVANSEGWSVVGACLRSPDVRDGLKHQNCRYTLFDHDTGPRQIECVENVFFAPTEFEELETHLIDPTTDLITITVTEKGYNYGPDGGLNWSNSMLQADLTDKTPKTLIGILSRSLSKRSAPVTVMSCDNLTLNGSKLQRAVEDFSHRTGTRVSTKRFAFPNTMVDRITPATDDKLRAQADDPMVVPTEGFWEWVIEDKFAGHRPQWNGVQFVDDVLPHEMRKLRLLNGAHSLLAYAGILAGHEYVHEAIADPVLRRMASKFMQQASLTLPTHIQEQAPEYGDRLLQRFENPQIRHNLRQIAMDGSLKLPIRMVNTLSELLKADHANDAIRFGIRSWVDFCKSEKSGGRELQDPISRTLSAQPTTDELLSHIGAADLHRQIYQTNPI